MAGASYDRLSWVFASGLQAALVSLIGGATDGRHPIAPMAMCATEGKGAFSPKTVQTTIRRVLASSPLLFGLAMRA